MRRAAAHRLNSWRLVFGGAIVASGIALMDSAVLRQRRRGQPDDGLAC